MTSPYPALATEVHELMRSLAASLDEREADARADRQRMDQLITAVLDVLDSVERVAAMLQGSEAAEAVATIQRQIEHLLISRGYTLLRFDPGELPPLHEVQVISSTHDPCRAEMTVLSTSQTGLREGQRVVRRAGVHVSKR